MLGAPVALGLAQNAERFRKRHFRVRPVDEQEIDPGELQLLQALIERALEVGGGKLVVKDLGGDENMLALEAGGAQPATQSLTDLALVAVALGGVNVTITDTERGLDRVDADRVHERHGAEPDRGNPCAVGFDEIHGMPPHSEAPSSQHFQRPEGAVLIASQTQTGYWMPRLRRTVTGCPAFAGRGNRIFGGGRFSAPAPPR